MQEYIDALIGATLGVSFALGSIFWAIVFSYFRRPSAS